MRCNFLFATLICLSLVLPLRATFGDEGERSSGKGKPDFVPVTNALYKEDCGSCHFAYQPGLLPERSWNKIMKNLNSHFGDNAELSTEIRQQILDYLVHNSADKVNGRRSQKIMRSISTTATPLRITETAYIKRKHDEIPGRLIAGNDKVVSLSRCEACHQKAQEGSYDESQISIPGYGKWDD